MADVEDGLAVAPGSLAHLGQALFLELHVTDGEDLVHDHNFAVQMGGNGECQFHEHAAGIALDRRVDKVADLGELNNFRHLGVNFGAGHTQNRAVQVDVFPARHLGVEAGADLEHRGDAAIQVNVAGGGGCDVGQQL